MSKVMEYRLNWHASTDTKFNFKWKYNSNGLIYNSLCLENYSNVDCYQVKIISNITNKITFI